MILIFEVACACDKFIILVLLLLLLVALISICGLLALSERIVAGLSLRVKLLRSGDEEAVASVLFASSKLLAPFSEANPPFERRRLDTIFERVSVCVCDCDCDFLEDDAAVGVLPESSAIIMHWKGKR